MTDPPIGADVPRIETLTRSTEQRHWRRLLAISLIVFIGIALEVAFGRRLLAVDRHLTQRLQIHGPGAWNDLMQVLAQVHGVAGIAVVGACWAAWLGCRGQTLQLARLALCVGGGLVLNSALKLAFRRDRPVWDAGFEPLLEGLPTYSFPSGHVSGSVVFYGFVLMTVFARTTQRGWRFTAVAAACAMVVLVAYNRVYVGAHFLSDVLAALAEGLAWLAFCALLSGPWRRRWPA